MKTLKVAAILMGFIALMLAFAPDMIADTVTWTNDSGTTIGPTRGFKSSQVIISGLKVTGTGDNASLVLSPSTASLAAYWNFDEPSGDVLIDCSGKGNAGSMLNGLSRVPSKAGFGSALSFNGLASYADFGNVSALNSASAFTIEAWIKQADNSVFDRIMGKAIDDTKDVIISSAFGSLYVDIGNGSNVQKKWTGYAVTVPSGTWFHFAVTFSGGAADKVKIYINGNKVTLTASVGGEFPSVTADFNATAVMLQKVFLAGSVLDGNFFSGEIDELRIYTKALSDTDIRAHFEAVEPF